MTGSPADLRFADVVEGVRAAIAAYALALDDGRTDDVVATFCEDGVAEIPGAGVLEGHEAIRASFSKWKPRRPQRHVIANTHVGEWSQSSASAVSDLVFMLKGDDGWTVQMVGRYHDTLRNESGTWRFARRVASFD